MRRALLAAFALTAALGSLLAHASVDWLELYNTHTHETLKVTFRDRSGFVPQALAQLEMILGDHRSGEHHAMDPQLYVLLVDLAAAAGVEPRYEIISGYRSSETNETLRSNGGGQAKNSQHIQGKAIDVRLKGVSSKRLRDLAMQLKRGGVGYYEKSDFVHVDTARVRYWEGRSETVVPDDAKVEQHVFLARSGADVVDHEGSTVIGLPVAHDANVKRAAAEVPGDDVAR
jgi:uncharacterized protein YcbK (DUF882 family)